MAKPSDKQDSTQPLSSSQIVAVTPAAKPRGEPIDRNDRSVWKHVVVGADDFGVAPVKRKRTGLWIVIGVVVAGGAAAAIYVATRSSSSAVAADAAVVAVPDAAAMAVPPVVVDAPPVDAPADAPIDAPVDAPDDAGVAVDAGVKPPAKKPPAKKPPLKRPKPH